MSETKFFNGVGELNRPTGISRDVVLRTLNLVWPDTGLTEIRIIAKHRWETKKVKDKEEPLTEILKGYFNEPLLIPDPLEKKLDELEKNGFNAQAYFLLNDINPDCQKVKTLSESELNQFSRGTATGDTDIVRRKWLLIDADPERAPHTSSTDEEKKNAYDVILQIKDKLQGFCFKDPVIASSGNGWHLLYRIDEPNDDETKNRISTILKGLKKEYGGDVDIDSKVGNASRICKLYGTIARKGEHTEERPHRLAEIAEIPPPRDIPPAESVRELAAYYKEAEWANEQMQAQAQGRRPTKGGKRKAVDYFKTLDELREFLQTHDVGVQSERPGTQGATLLRVDCPNASAHSDGSISDAHITFFPTGWSTFGCFHDHCSGISTEEFFHLIDPRLKSDGQFGDWRDGLEKDEKTGKILKTPENIRTITLEDAAMKQVYYNDFEKSDFTTYEDFHNVTDNSLTDESCLKIQRYISNSYNLTLSKSQIMDALTATRKERAVNPVKEYIEAEKWDGVNRIDTVVIRYLGAEDNETTREATRKFLISAVKRVYEPGCKSDYVLTLVGPEGWGKSTFFKILANDGKWHTDCVTISDPRKTQHEAYKGKWIVELAELAGMKKADAESLKNFISSSVDTYRPAYAVNSENFPRQCVFVATTNESSPLRGNDGNRRFWIVQTPGRGKPYEWAAELEKVVPQLWAEAYTAYISGEPTYLSDNCERIMRERQRESNEANESDIKHLVEAIVNNPVPADYYGMTMNERHQYQQQTLGGHPSWNSQYLRKYALASEIIEESPDDRLRAKTASGKGTIMTVNGILTALGWQKLNATNRTKPGTPGGCKTTRHGGQRNLFLRPGYEDDLEWLIKLDGAELPEYDDDDDF